MYIFYYFFFLKLDYIVAEIIYHIFDLNLIFLSVLYDYIYIIIGSIHLKTSKVMINQEKDNIRYFINKVNEIKKEFENER